MSPRLEDGYDSLLGPSFAVDLVEVESFRANSAQVSLAPTIGGILNRGIGVINDMLLDVPGDVAK